MLIHILMFILSIFVFCVRKWGNVTVLRTIEEREFRLFLVILLVANLMGCGMTIMQKAHPLGELKLTKDTLGIREEKFDIEVEGQPQQIKVEIPGKEQEQNEDMEKDTQKSWKDQLIEDIRDYNREKDDPDYYYLPQKWNGEELHWRIPADTSGTLLAVFGLLSGSLIILMGMRQKAQSLLRRQEQLLMDYPGLIMKFTLLVQAGLSLRKAFQKISVDYKKTKTENRWAYEEIIVICNELESGISENEAYYHYGERCGQVKYKVFSTLLVQNLHMGSAYLAAMLEQEATSAWEERKRKAKVLGEVAATKLLVPMVMMMFVVMVIVMVPAFLSFYGT